MHTFALRYSKALAALLLAMGGYSLLIVPWVEPTSTTESKPPNFARTLGGERWWRDFFPEGSWQTGEPKIIHTDKGILLSQSWTSIDEKTWELKPLTMILSPTKTAREAIREQQTDIIAKQEMWIVECQQGATIHFAEPLDITSGKVPMVERGDLSGPIQVSRKAASQAKDDSWRILTYDLTIDRRQFSTQREVLIEWNDSVIQGRDMKVMLRGDLLQSQNADSAWGPLDELELYHVDKIDVALPPGGLWADMKLKRLDEQPALRTLPARMKATCGGRFAFDFKSSTASLQNGVQLHHFLGDLPPDEFQCQSVSFAIELDESESSASQSSTSQSEDGLSKARLLSLEAIGIDSLQEFVGEKWVEFTAPTMGIEARCKKLNVDFEQRRVEFAGRLDHPEATQSIAILKYDGNEFRSPKIEYQAAPDAEGHDAEGEGNGDQKHLGWMFAEGPGELITAAQDKLGKSNIRWQQSLRMAPDSQSDKRQWIEIVGNALVESKLRGFLASERIELWLTQSDQASLISAAPVAGATELSDRYLPERVLAEGQTVLSTKTLQAHVSQLSLDLLFIPQDPVTKESDGLALSDSSGNPMYQWVSPPESPSLPGSPGESPPTEDPTPKTPVVVEGAALQAKIVVAGKDAWVDHLHMQGPVKVSREATDPQKSMPWHIEGSQLVLATNREGQANIQIDGQRAKIVVAEGSLQGTRIHFDQTSNQMWMNQPGEFSIPVSALKSSAKPGKPRIEWINAPHCKWDGKMLFDGSVARIVGAIEFDAAMRNPQNQFWWVKGSCGEMNVILSAPIDFNATDEQDVELERVELSDRVHILASQLMQNGDIESRQQLSVPHLRFFAVQQQLVAQGPGWVKSRFLAKRGFGQIASERKAEARRELQASHLNFRDSLVGFVDRNEVVVDGKVELAVGPINNWDQSIDVNQLNTLSDGQMLLNCDQLKVYDTAELSTVGSLASTGKAPEAWEFQATGNVAFNGKAETGDYVGNGYQVTYVQAKDLLMLRGDGHDPAYLRRAPLASDENLFEAFVETAAINPRTLSIVDLRIAQGGLQVSNANSNLVPNNGAPNRAPFSGSGAPPINPGRSNPRRDFYERNR